MPVLRDTATTRLHRKVCLSCGYRGRHLQGERGRFTFRCPACDADLYARPPRSYAEMEGVVPEWQTSPRLTNPPLLARSRDGCCVTGVIVRIGVAVCAALLIAALAGAAAT